MTSPLLALCSNQINSYWCAAYPETCISTRTLPGIKLVLLHEDRRGWRGSETLPTAETHSSLVLLTLHCAPRLASALIDFVVAWPFTNPTSCCGNTLCSLQVWSQVTTLWVVLPHHHFQRTGTCQWIGLQTRLIRYRSSISECSGSNHVLSKLSLWWWLTLAF